MNHESTRGDGVEMPRSTLWPMVLSLGLVLCGAGVALDTVPFLAIGGLLFLRGLCGWFAELLPGRGHEWEKFETFPATIESRPGTVEQLVPGMAGYRFRLPEKVHPISAGLKGGIVGGLVMPIPALAWGELSGHGIWFPVNLLAGMALPGVDSMPVAELEQFRATLLVLGIALHAAMSITIGLMYGVLLPTIPGASRWQLICGGWLIPLLWTGASYGLMGVANPLLQHYVDWFWFTLSQLVFGLTAAIVVIRSEKVVIPPAGPGSPTATDPAFPEGGSR